MCGADREFQGVAPLERAGPQDAAYAEKAPGGPVQAGVLLTREPVPGCCCVLAGDPKLAFIQLLERLFPAAHRPGVHLGAHVDPSAQLGEGVAVVGTAADAWTGIDMGHVTRSMTSHMA